MKLTDIGWQKIKAMTLMLLLITITLGMVNDQTDCEKAVERARLDFKKSDYSFHSEEMLPVENTYFYVLKNYYDIDWYFTDSLEYYQYYDSIMVDLLKEKYGIDFLQKARLITDSLDNSKNWKKEAEFPGGAKELYKFISSRLTGQSFKIDTIKTKSRIYIHLEIDSTGKVSNTKVWRGINNTIDNKVLEVIKQLPNWEPAYLYGKPIRQLYSIPIFIDYPLEPR